MSSAGPRQYGTSKMRTSPPTRSASWRGAVRVGPQRPPDAEQVRPQPERVAALDVPGASIRPIVGIPNAVVQASSAAGSGRPIGLARPERDRAAVGHQERVEGVDEVGRRELRLEDVDPRSERGEDVDEGVVLATRELEVDRVQEPVGRVVERGAERRAGPLHEHVAQWRRHALGAEPASDGRHRRQHIRALAAVARSAAIARRESKSAPASGALRWMWSDVRRRRRWRRPRRRRPRPPA